MKVLRFPVLSASLAAAWLALTDASAANVLLGVALGLAIPLAVAPLLEGLPRLRAPGRAARLLMHVFWDILVANAVVARLVLGRLDRLRPAFVEVPLAITHPHAIALLATIITMTPGTVSVALSPDGRTLEVHALDVDDVEALVATIKSRYEEPLAEVIVW